MGEQPKAETSDKASRRGPLEDNHILVKLLAFIALSVFSYNLLSFNRNSDFFTRYDESLLYASIASFLIISTFSDTLIQFAHPILR